MAQLQSSMNPWGMPLEENKSQMPGGLAGLMADYRSQGSGDASEGAQMAPQLAPAAEPMKLEGLKPESDVKDIAKNKGELGKAGILAASTLLGKLMEAKAMREKLMRERKSESEKQVAQSTQEMLKQQQAGIQNPLTQLIGAYRGAM